MNLTNKRIFTREILLEKEHSYVVPAKDRVAYEISISTWDYLENTHSGNTLFNYSNILKGDGIVLNFKSRTHITPELINDLNVHTGIDAKKELSSLISENIQSETMRAVFKNIIEGKGKKSLLIEKLSEFNGFFTKITKKQLFNFLSKTNDRYNDYFFICSAEIAYYFDDEIDFHIDVDRPMEETCLAMGLEWFGIYKNKKILKDPYLPANTCALIKGIEKTKYNVDFNYRYLTNNPTDFSPAYRGHIISVEIPKKVDCKSFKIEDINEARYEF